jgi:hypothetical protein
MLGSHSGYNGNGGSKNISQPSHLASVIDSCFDGGMTGTWPDPEHHSRQPAFVIEGDTSRNLLPKGRSQSAGCRGFSE